MGLPLSFEFLPSFSMGVKFQSKEFAPLRANSFLYKLTPFERALLVLNNVLLK